MRKTNRKVPSSSSSKPLPTGHLPMTSAAAANTFIYHHEDDEQDDDDDEEEKEVDQLAATDREKGV
jgi:hypothetical protein